MNKSIVVLLHSSAASARQWDALARMLAARFDVHGIDLWGHGTRAPWHGARPLALADEAALVEPVLERGRRVHLVGHSYGGAVALEVARRQPGAVASVAVFEPVLFRLLRDDAASHDTWQAVAALSAALNACVAQQRNDAAGEHFIDFWSGARAWARLAAVQRESIVRRMPSVARHFDAVFTAADPRLALAQAGMPLLCMAGDRSVAPTRRIAQLLAATLPHAAHESLPAMGHMGPLTHTAAVNGRITDFLDRQVEPARPRVAFSSSFFSNHPLTV